MNIMEIVWGWLMKILNVATIEQLKQSVEQHCSKSAPRAMRRLYRGMPQQIRRLRRMRGYPTKY